MRATNTNSLTANCWLHIVLSTLLLPVVYYGGEMFKYALVPYVFYLVNFKEEENFPALMILSTSGSTLSYLIAVFVIIKTFKYQNLFRLFGVLNLYRLLLLPLPIIFFQIFYRLFVLKLGFIGSLVPSAYYFSIFPFFYGVLIGLKTSKININLFLIPVTILTVFEIFNLSLVGDTLRVTIMLTVYLISILIIRFGTIVKTNNIDWRYFGLAALIFIGYVSGFLNFSFSFLLSILIGVLITVSKFFRWKKVLKFFSSVYLPIILGLITVIGIRFAMDLGREANLHKESIDFLNFSEYPKYLKYKLFGDRGVVWAGVTQDIILNGSFLPPLVERTYSFTNISGTEIDEVSFGAHNLTLELIHKMGWMIGLILIYCIFRIVFGMVKRISDLPLNKVKVSEIVFISGIIGITIAIILFGQFIVQANVALLIFGALGYFYGKYSKGNNPLLN